MDQTNGSSDGGYGPRPPPYNQPYYGQNPYPANNVQDFDQSSYPAVSYQVGKGNIAVVSPAGHYDNMVHPEERDADGSQPSGEEPPPDYTEGFEDDNCFNDAAIRRGFIRKVYLTLMLQLLVTVGIICAFQFWDTLREWAYSNNWFSYAMMVAVVVLIVALSCCDSVRRKVPLNFIALGLFTIAEGLMLGSVTVYFEAEAVLWAVGATALVSFALSLFAMQSRFDFTAASGCLWAFGWTLVSFALLCAIMRSQYLYIVYACLGTLLFSMYLVMDTQLILGGKHRKYSVSPEEYVFAALNLYLDVVTLFLLLLQLIGLCR